MKFLICPVSQEQLHNTSMDGYFVDAEGNLYNYRVTFNESDMVRIEDSVGRYVPIDITELRELTEVLIRICNFEHTKEVVQTLMFESLTNGQTIQNQPTT